ncbi:MAG: hypothetical protein FJY56_15150 [Betaproteobacteria bacterium]|nr:hypothetical protein [Betaproteobacteria bacterium]
MRYPSIIALCAAAWAAPMAHAAQPAPAAPATAPTEAGARVPPIHYDSAFSGYQSHREQKLAPWREANDEVHRAGGHIGIFGGAAGKPAAQHPPGHKK